MKFYFNILFLICLSFFMVSCSSINDWDVSKIIDKTERWLFDDVEDNPDEKERPKHAFPLNVIIVYDEDDKEDITLENE